MIIKHINLLIVVILSIEVVSCSKFLDKKSNNRLAVPTTIANLQALLDDAIVMNRQVTPSFGESSADDYFLLKTTFDTKNTRDQSFYLWAQFENYAYQNDWSLNYVPVFNSNYCLDMIDKISVSNDNKQDWNNIKGSAYFFRSYYFLQLAWTYAKAYDASTANSDLGIVLRLGSDFTVASTRANLQETYDKIISDAKESISYLPEIPKHLFRPSKGAAYGLLARAYLSMRQYDSAFKYANLCLQSKNQLINYNGDSDFNGVNASFPIKQFNKETIFYTEMNLICTNVNSSSAKIDSVLFSKYAGNDLRRKAFFRLNSGYQQFKGNYTASVRLFSGIAIDELFLIRAECYARQGDKTSALNDLNTLLSKRYDPTFLPVTATDANEALGIILIERRKELVFRGIRFSDIKRLNKEGANLTLQRIMNGQTYTLSPNDKRYALPIPREIIVETGIQQN